MADGSNPAPGRDPQGPAPEVYAICTLDTIAPGRAEAFNLARVSEDGTPLAFPVLIVRRDPHVYAYVNCCPHEGVPLNFEPRQFFDQGRRHLMCGKHGALFAIDSGECVEGPCQGANLEPVACFVLDGDICITGVTLLEDDETDEPPEVMIYPE